MNDLLYCKLCLLDRRSAKLPPSLEEQPSYSTSDALRDHWNTAHEWPGNKPSRWKGTEPAWPSILREARRIAAGFLTACGDTEGTYHVLWCLRCNYETSDPLAVVQRRCPKCGRSYSELFKGAFHA